MQLARLKQRLPLFLAGLALVTLAALAFLAFRGPSAPPPPAAQLVPAEVRGELLVHIDVAHGAELARGPRGKDAGVCRLDAGNCVPPGSTRALAGAELRLFRALLPEGRYEASGTVLTDAAGNARVELAAGTYWLLVDAEGWARHSEPVSFEGGTQRLSLRLAPALPLSVSVKDRALRPIAGARVSVQGSDVLPHLGTTSELGLATFDHVAEGPSSVHVSAAGYEEVTVDSSQREVAVTLDLPLALSVRVLDANGQPAIGAKVSFAGANVWPARQLETGTDGVAHLTGLSSGLYDLRAELGSRVSKSLTGVGVGPSEPASFTLELRDGHFVTVRVHEAEAGSAMPIAGADVSLVEGGLGPFPLRGSSNAQGVVRLGPLPPGAVSLSVHARGFMSESGLELELDRDREKEVSLLRAGRLSGRVVDAQGSPIEGATLEVVGNDLHGRPIAKRSDLGRLPPAFFESVDRTRPLMVPLGELGVVPGPLPVPGSLPMNAPPPSSAWITDLDGRYRLDEVPPGRLRVLARHPDFVAGTSQVATLAPGGSAELEVVLSAGAALEGRVVDEHGRPVARARVDAVASHAAGHATALTQSDGYFAFGSVATEVDLFVARPGDRYRFVMRQTLALAAGERREVQLTLPRERSPVVVRVNDDSGEPLAGARVTLLSLDPEVPLRLTLPTGGDGRVKIDDAEGLRCTLRVLARNFRPFTLPLDALPPELVVGMDRGLIATGVVTVVRGRQGLEGARVVLTQGGERKIASTDAEGEYRFEDVAPGHADLEISHADYSTERRSIVIAAGRDPEQPVELASIELEAAGSVAGRVIDESGAPVRGARVALDFVPAFLPAGPVPADVVQSDTEGRFTLVSVPVGNAKLSAYAAGIGRGTLLDVPVRAGELTEGVEIQLYGGDLELESEAPASLAITLGERGLDAGLEVVVVDVAPQSEAARAGLRAGDIVLSVDGEPVMDMVDARRRASGSDGSDVVLELERDGELLSLRVRREAVRR